MGESGLIDEVHLLIKCFQANGYSQARSVLDRVVDTKDRNIPRGLRADSSASELRYADEFKTDDNWIYL